ncbi:hypothetical protein GCM10023258_04650 [Terrabacter aeriphilus]|uniref:Serine protease n=1 Tax=Terrabacter aeriphilus TaxID=515662 RepID=A0ABP9J1X0_9MICO
MTDQPPQYGAYPDPNLPPRSDGTPFTSPGEHVAVSSPPPTPTKRRTGLIVGAILTVAALATGGYSSSPTWRLRQP